MILQPLIEAWQARQRRLDLQILWPACKQEAPDLAHARSAFAFHAVQDASWQALGETEIYRQIGELV